MCISIIGLLRFTRSEEVFEGPNESGSAVYVNTNTLTELVYMLAVPWHLFREHCFVYVYLSVHTNPVVHKN